MEAVWPDSIVEENNLSQNISTLRRLFGESPGSGRFIVTVPGRGYRFAAEVTMPEQTPIKANGAASWQPERAAKVRTGAAHHGSAAHNSISRAQGNLAESHSTASVQAADDIRRYSSGAYRRRWLLIAGASGFALGLAALLVWRSLQHDLATTPVLTEKSIAVLPFENLSAEKDDAFFADGIQDDVLTSIAKIKNLKVIARPSVASYRGPAVVGQLREIGETLGVTNLLHGSVRRAGNRVVINMTLIDTRDDRQLWSERYERTLTDMLSLQGEVAVEIARALQATLSPMERTETAAWPTDNPDAYVLFLRARSISSELRFRASREEWEAAGRFFTIKPLSWIQISLWPGLGSPSC